jgi:nucleoid-associated protein YgaU
LTVVSVVALCAVGCERSQKLESLQKQNQTLTQRVAELEDQLKQQADAAVSTATTNAQALVGESVYIVVEGDNLWSIAKKQLGNGTRYKEILALNPHITKDKPLAIGIKLKMPPQ